MGGQGHPCWSALLEAMNRVDDYVTATGDVVVEVRVAVRGLGLAVRLTHRALPLLTRDGGVSASESCSFYGAAITSTEP